ncbi:TM234 protein, partial [Passerina amoena]|nr:TM234 protein [Passerina amoena]
LLRAPAGRASGTARCSAGQALALALVAALWGGTAPFLRAAAAGMEELQGRGRLRQLLAELRFLSLNWQV